MFEKTLIPDVQHGFIRRASGTFGYHAWGSVCKDENGVLYAVCSGFRVRHICPFGKTVMFISRDEGKTWSCPIVINDTELDDRDVGILYLGNGKLLVTWFCHYSKSYQEVYRNSIVGNDADSDLMTAMLNRYDTLSEEDAAGGSFIRISNDYGFTWGETIRVPISTPHGPTLLSDGSLIYPGVDHPANRYGRRASNTMHVYRNRSGDGKDWEHAADIKAPPTCPDADIVEPNIIELPGGTLLCAIRAQGKGIEQHFRVFTSFSEDGGTTWTTPEDTGIIGSPPHLLLHSSGVLVMVYGRRDNPLGERAALSYDFGKTWTTECILFDNAPDLDLGYPCSVELSDGKILTVYYQIADGDTKPSFMYTIWELPKK